MDRTVTAAVPYFCNTTAGALIEQYDGSQRFARNRDQEDCGDTGGIRRRGFHLEYRQVPAVRF